MARRVRYSVTLLWVASLVLTGILASAQTRRESGAMISGDDIGFRPEGWSGKARTGTLMVRINGEWVEAQGLVKMVPATR
jgi:hypothetical protein